jgi:hypothetical protein
VIKRREIVLGGASLISCFGRFSYTSMARAASSDKFEVVKSDEEWRRELTGEQYAVLRRPTPSALGQALSIRNTVAANSAQLTSTGDAHARQQNRFSRGMAEGAP